MDVPPTPPHEGLNFYVPWEFLEYVIGGMLTAGVSVAAWVWHLGGRVDRLEDSRSDVARQIGEQYAKIERLERALGEKLYEAEQARAELRDELMTRLSNLPSREFIESQIQQLTQRMDGLIDWKLRTRKEGD